jgi:anti-sigma regulatory factor (Ser/Thr protein kinase)
MPPRRRRSVDPAGDPSAPDLPAGDEPILDAPAGQDPEQHAEQYGPEVQRAEIGVRASPAELRGLRHRVVEFARETGGDDDVVESLELAVSELATNVIQYTDADEIHVVVQCTPSRWILDVGDADDLELPADIPMPPASAAEGRGLYVTRSVMDTLTAVDVDGRRVVRCTKTAR